VGVEGRARHSTLSPSLLPYSHVRFRADPTILILKGDQRGRCIARL